MAAKLDDETKRLRALKDGELADAVGALKAQAAATGQQPLPWWVSLEITEGGAMLIRTPSSCRFCRAGDDWRAIAAQLVDPRLDVPPRANC